MQKSDSQPLKYSYTLIGIIIKISCHIVISWRDSSEFDFQREKILPIISEIVSVHKSIVRVS